MKNLLTKLIFVFCLFPVGFLMGQAVPLVTYKITVDPPVGTACTAFNTIQANSMTGTQWACPINTKIWTQVNAAGGGGATTPATALILKGNGSTNGVVPAAPGTDYVIPSGTVATADAFSLTPAQAATHQVCNGVAANGNCNSVAVDYSWLTGSPVAPSQAATTFTANPTGSTAPPIGITPTAAAALLPLGGTGTYVNGFGNPNNLQTQSPLAGAVTRTGNAKLSDTPSVLDVSSVQTALGLSVGAGKLGFLVPDGNYTLTSMLSAYCSACPNLSLHGNSPNSTALSYTGSGTVNAVLEVASDASPGTAGFYSATLRDISAIGNGHNTFAWHFVNPSTSLFENLNAGGAQTTSGGYGFGFVGGSGILLKSLNCSPFVLLGGTSGAMWPGGIIPWGCYDFEPGSTGPDIITSEGGNCSYIGPGPCWHIGGGGAGINSTGSHNTQLGGTPTTLFISDAGARQITFRDCLFEVSTGTSTDIAVIASDTTNFYNCDFTAGHVHFTGGHSGIFGDGSVIGNDGQLVIDAAVQSLLVSGAQFNTANAITDNSTSTTYENNWDVQNGHPLMNWPNQEMYETRTCPTCDASGGNLGDSVYHFHNLWTAGVGTPMPISPVVFTKGMAWTARLHGSFLASGQPISSVTLNDQIIGDSHNTVTLSNPTAVLTFTVDATTGKFTMASNANNLGFSGDIIFTPWSNTAAGGGFIGTAFGSDYSIIEDPSGLLSIRNAGNGYDGMAMMQFNKSTGAISIPAPTTFSTSASATTPVTAVSGAANAGPLVIHNTNSGFSNSLLYGYVDAAPSTGFNLLDLRASGGSAGEFQVDGTGAIITGVRSPSAIISGLTPGNCVQTGSGGSLTTVLLPCGTGLGFSSSAVTFTAGTNITSVTCTTTCDLNAGSLSIVAGALASTGTFATMNYTQSPAPRVCGVSMNGGAVFLGLGHGTPSTSALTLTSAVSVSATTFTMDYWCKP